MHGCVAVVAGEVVQDTQSSDFSPPSANKSALCPSSEDVNRRNPALFCLELSELTCKEYDEFVRRNRLQDCPTPDRYADRVPVLVRNGDVDIGGQVPPVEFRGEVSMPDGVA